MRAGGHVSIVWITSGDASELDLLVIEKRLFVKPEQLRGLALRRMQESRNAAAVLGVTPDQQFFLGYPDRGVFALMTDYYATPYRSKYTATANVPYPAALVPGHPYTGRSLEHDFDTVLDRVHPTLILAPSPRDLHPDHRASGILAIQAASRRDELSKVRFWIVHGGDGWPGPRGYKPELPQSIPPRGRSLTQVTFQLEPAEVQHKLLAVRAYRTQMQVMSAILLSFVRSTEVYFSNPMPPERAAE